MAWKKFDRRTASRTTQATITLQRRGTISLSGPAVELLMGTKDYLDKISVELLFDPDRKLVGICQADPDNPNPHLLRRQGTSDVYLVSGTLFCAHHKLDTSLARRYIAREHEGILGINLDGPHAVVGRKRKDEVQETKERDDEEDSAASEDVADQSENPIEASKQDPWAD